MCVWGGGPLGFVYESPLTAVQIIIHQPILLLPQGENYIKQFILKQGALLAPVGLLTSMSCLSLPVLHLPEM